MTDITVRLCRRRKNANGIGRLCRCENGRVCDDRRIIEATLTYPPPHGFPQNIALRSAVSYVSGAGTAALRVEGIGTSVDARCASLREELSAFGDVEKLHSHNSGAFWGGNQG